MCICVYSPHLCSVAGLLYLNCKVDELVTSVFLKFSVPNVPAVMYVCLKASTFYYILTCVEVLLSLN